MKRVGRRKPGRKQVRRHVPRRVGIGAQDASLTTSSGVVALAESVDNLDVVGVVDRAVGAIKQPARGVGAGELLVALAPSQLLGGDALAALDRQRADVATTELSAVPGIPATTAGALARRFGAQQFVGIEAASAELVGRAVGMLPAERRVALSGAVTVDLYSTDGEVYGSRKQGAYNDAGQRAGRPHLGTPLSEEATSMSALPVQYLAAQLAWTLRREWPNVTRVELTAGGRVQQVRDFDDGFSVQAFQAYGGARACGGGSRERRRQAGCSSETRARPGRRRGASPTPTTPTTPCPRGFGYQSPSTGRRSSRPPASCPCGPATSPPARTPTCPRSSAPQTACCTAARSSSGGPRSRPASPCSRRSTSAEPRFAPDSATVRGPLELLMGMQHTQTTAGATSKEDGVDPDAVARFAAAEEQRLLRYAYLVSRSYDDARDLVQTAFAGMLSVSSRISDPSSYARRIILNEVRRQSRRRVSLLAPTTTMHAGHEADLVEQDAMWRALGTLPARQRAVLVLRYYETLDDQTIATVLKCRRSTVRSLAARGLRALKRTQEVDVAGLESEGSRG